MSAGSRNEEKKAEEKKLVCFMAILGAFRRGS